MTQTEYEKSKNECWKQFCKDNDIVGNVHFLAPAAFVYAFDRAYALGKQEKDADAVISGWVARDSNGNLYFYRCKPERVRYINSNDGLWMSETINELNSDLFHDLTWESDPEPVEIIIKRKKNE